MVGEDEKGFSILQSKGEKRREVTGEDIPVDLLKELGENRLTELI